MLLHFQLIIDTINPDHRHRTRHYSGTLLPAPAFKHPLPVLLTGRYRLLCNPEITLNALVAIQNRAGAPERRNQI